MYIRSAVDIPTLVVMLNMEQLIESIYETLQDYRADDNRSIVRMTRERIRNWINQFDEPDRNPLLQELDNIFKKRYCSKEKVKDFLGQVVTKLTEDFNFQTPQDFLRNSDFLDLQPEGKSQKIMLQLFDELIQEKYSLSLSDCGTASKRYSIYIDDILCTGNTLIQDVREWSEGTFSGTKSNKDAVADNSTTLVFTYIFIHSKNYFKKKAEMRHKISPDISNKHKRYQLILIENGTDANSALDIVWPLADNQPQIVADYKDQIEAEVDQYIQRYNSTSSDEFYRPVGLPANETFFTSAANRKRVENAFLRKGIEILRTTATNLPNIRALGYSLPSHKNFGYGALCFTWRNVPNNAPLVFWYSGGGFTPLFKVQRGELSYFFAKFQTQHW